MRVWLAYIQGIYFAVTGLWAILDIDSFMLVTGPKTDIWLVKTVALLILAVGICLIVAAHLKEALFSIAALAVMSAGFLGWSDFYYSLNDTIWDIYQLDGVAEAGLVVAWLYCLFRPYRSSREPNADRFLPNLERIRK